MPGTGKSTWVKNNVTNGIVLSTDNLIEECASLWGKTYDEIFSLHIKYAEKDMYEQLEEAIRNNQNIVFDRTNLTQKVRKKNLQKIPNNYEKHCVFFTIPSPEIWKERLKRPGKSIPKNVLGTMIKSIQIPEYSEGFKTITIVDNC